MNLPPLQLVEGCCHYLERTPHYSSIRCLLLGFEGWPPLVFDRRQWRKPAKRSLPSCELQTPWELAHPGPEVLHGWQLPKGRSAANSPSDLKPFADACQTPRKAVAKAYFVQAPGLELPPRPDFLNHHQAEK